MVPESGFHPRAGRAAAKTGAPRLWEDDDSLLEAGGTLVAMWDRKTCLVRASLPAAILVAWALATAAKGPVEEGYRWYKGNLHTHTTHSDGDSSPDAVARWYKEHGYQFLFLSDHNYFTDPGGLNQVFGAKERFLLIGAEEVTAHSQKKPVHVNAYGISQLVPPQFGPSVRETIQRNVDAVRAAGGIPSLNHPNFGWAVTPEDVAAVRNLRLIEVYNGHPTVHNEGGGGKPSAESIWDAALTAGRELFAVAVDDAHYFKRFGPGYSNPGRGWVVVKARELTARAILEGLKRGEFYASTGVELAAVERTENRLRVKIQRDRNFAYTTRYFGAGGKLLAESYELESGYTLKPGDRYVRATITDSMGRRAWTQPVFRR